MILRSGAIVTMDSTGRKDVDSQDRFSGDENSERVNQLRGEEDITLDRCESRYTVIRII